MQLAANDAQRGALPPAQLERVKNTIKDLVSELDSHDDKEPAPVKAGHADEAAARPRDERELPKAAPPDDAAQAPVVCLAGRGPLDETASAMLGQLLGKHGLRARTVPHAATSREGIGSLDVTGTAMICISHLDIAGSPSHLCYLMQRLTRRLPGVPVLVGLWPLEDEVLTSERVRSVIGADHYSTSLREVVNSCVAAARKAAEAGSEPAVPSAAA